MAHLCTLLLVILLIHANGIFPSRYIFITAVHVAECWLGSRVCWRTILWRLKIMIYQDASRWMFDYRPKVVMVKSMYWGSVLGVMSLSIYCFMFITATTPIMAFYVFWWPTPIGSTSYINLYYTGGDNFYFAWLYFVIVTFRIRRIGHAHCSTSTLIAQYLIYEVFFIQD